MSAEELARLLDPAEREAIGSFRAEVVTKGTPAIQSRLPGLVRRFGARLLDAPPPPATGEGCDLGSFRRADAAAALLLDALPADRFDQEILRLFRQGDGDEKRMILKALQVLRPSGAAPQILGEAHRQNDGLVFEAAFLDGDLAARTLPEEDFDRAVLKCAFIDAPIGRIRGLARRAHPALSSMILEFMTEREAAGRPVWAGSLELAAMAPVPGVLDRIRGELWHGDDSRRLLAARAAAVLASRGGRSGLEATLRERLQRERAPAVRAILESI